MVSRDLKGYAVTATLTGPDFHRHGDTLSTINRSLFLIPHSLGEACGFKATDRTCKALLGPGLGQRLHPSMVFPAFFLPDPRHPYRWAGVHTLCTPRQREPGVDLGSLIVSGAPV